MRESGILDHIGSIGENLRVKSEKDAVIRTLDRFYLDKIMAAHRAHLCPHHSYLPGLELVTYRFKGTYGISLYH